MLLAGTQTFCSTHVYSQMQALQYTQQSEARHAAHMDTVSDMLCITHGYRLVRAVQQTQLQSEIHCVFHMWLQSEALCATRTAAV